MKYLLAIDAGTGSIRALLFDTEGNQISIAQREWHHLEEPGVSNSMGFDFTTNWELTKACIREAVEKAAVDPESILALSATSMREGIVLYDHAGNELWGVANVDARAADEVRALKEEFPGIEEAFYATSGQTFALGALPRLLWLKNHRPDLYEKTATVSMIGDWVLAKLGGLIAVDPSNAGTTGIFSLQKRDWERSMAKRVGIKPDIFPPCYECGHPLSHVTKQAAKETGLSTSTRVVTGGGDVQLGSAGLGIVHEGEAAILGGSFWQQIVNIQSSVIPPYDMSVRVNPHVIPGLSQAEGITFFSGLVMRWFRDAFCDAEKAEAAKRGIDPYALLEERAAEVPVGSYDILPIFSDSMKYGRWYHAAPSFLNLSIDPALCNRASMFRSLEENACIVSKINLEKIETFTGIAIDTLVFAGGASKGRLWCQILSDVTGCRVKIPKVTEATALGAAMSAGVGAGIYPSLEAAAEKLVIWDREYLPDMEHHEIYKTVRKKWEKAYAAQLKLVDEGVTKSMWKAPGL